MSTVKSVDVASSISLEPGQFWSLLPGTDFTGQVIDDLGYIVEEVVVTDNAAIQDVEYWAAGWYLVRGNRDGERFEIEAFLEDDMPLILVDER